MPRGSNTGTGPHHHYSFWLLVAISLVILLSSHFALFRAEEVTPRDAINSPDAVLIAVAAAGLVVLAALLRSEVRERSKKSLETQREKPRRAA